ncbi:class I SAM-dependent methyltransferase [Candidatus Halobeggiatoa sp. HSG11]|nr:class I SAM-dependent methyltransferase [Candidatus Halobeggiatoa sp. HSG11]
MNIYDEIPYPSLVYTDTHPNKLATLATLFGIKPPTINNCRILELGCGDGTNLIAIAQSLPQATCIGIDFSATQITSGQKLIETIQLDNIALQQLDFTAVDESQGKFDYIIAHGIYSWVPLTMQDTMLNLIKKHLTSNGIAYISYNIYPGWHTENVVRDMMKYHLQQLPPLPAKDNVAQAKGILQFITNLRQSGNDSFDVLLKEKSQQLQTVDDSYLYHDFLEQENHPVYFHQFITHIGQHDLTYITDIEFRHYLMVNFPPQVVETMQELFQDDFFKQEQYLDFFYHRTLRRSLLCQQTAKRTVDWQKLLDCYVATDLKIEGENITTSTGEILEFQHPITKIAIRYLSEIYPQRLAFKELFKRSKRPAKNLSALRNNLAQELLQLYYLEIIELHVEPAPFTTKIEKFPTASPLARQSISPHPINLHCEFVELSDIAKKILPYLNGKNDKSELLKMLGDVTKSRLNDALLEIARNALLIK